MVPVLSRLAPLALAAALLIGGCAKAEEPAVPLDPAAQQMVKEGKTGIPDEAKKAMGAQDPTAASRGAGIK